LGRYRFADDAAETLLQRQLSWPLWQGAAFGALTAAGLATQQPALAVALSLGVAMAGTYYRQLPRVAPIAVALVVAVWVIGRLAPSAAVSAAQILAAGAIVGAGMFSLEQTPPDRWQLVQATLAGTAAAGLGWWVAARLLGGLPAAPLLAGVHGALFGLIAGQGMLVAALRYRTVERIPSPPRIKATLKADYQPACLKAWRIDRELARSAPDPETRDGLGELAAWIYKLVWSMQMLDREIEEISDVDLQERIVDAYEKAEASDDDFIRERRIAAARHLEQLAQHRLDLILERQRLAALVDYAGAYQEEARAGLVLARLQPGDHTPARLEDVLQKLRSHSNAQIVQRRTARELAQLPTA
jgi:hypothetical protein